MDFESKAMNRFLLVSFLMSLIALATNGAEEMYLEITGDKESFFVFD